MNGELTAADLAKLAMFESGWFGSGPAFWRWVDTEEAEPYVAAFIAQQQPLAPDEPLDLIGGYDDEEDLGLLDTTDFAALRASIEARYDAAAKSGR